MPNWLTSWFLNKLCMRKNFKFRGVYCNKFESMDCVKGSIICLDEFLMYIVLYNAMLL